MRYTKAQVGAGAVPDAHFPGPITPAQLVNEDTGGQLDAAPSQQPPNGIRGWRARGGAGQAAPPAAANFDAGRPALEAEHLTRGQPAARPNELAPSGLPYGCDTPEEAPIPETVTAGWAPVVTAIAEPDRARAGSTADRDPGRPANTRFLDYLLRPWDKLIAEHPGVIERVYQPAPFAARPRQYAAAIPDAHASPGGHEPTFGGAGVGIGPQLATVRLQPLPWDVALVNTGGAAGAAYADPGAAAIAGRRSSGWRA